MDTPPDLYVVLFLGRFLSILYEAMPFIVLGAVIAGFLEELVPQHVISRFIPRNHVLAIGLSALLGLVFPMCECGIVPVMRRLLRKGLPLSCCVAYMLAGPIINVVVISSTFVAFARHNYGYWIVGLRVFLGFLVAVGTAVIVHMQYRKYGDKLLHRVSSPSPIHAEVDEELHVEEARKPIMQRLGNITETALHDFVDITLFLILGALLAAGVGLLISRNDMETLSNTYPILAILAMMAMAILLCLCSEADAFVAASFIALHPAAKLAFLVLGPMLDLKLFMMFTRVFRFRLIWTIVAALLVQVLLYSMLCYYLFEAGIPAKIDTWLQPSVPAATSDQP
jgi:uncharacterized membrane protein YraQ (UPF0718 family)